MDINIVKEKKKILQDEISKEVSKLVEAFISDTGVNPLSISISMLSKYGIGRSLVYSVGETKIQLDI